jgi:Ca2+-binding RTX toxin-like protein
MFEALESRRMLSTVKATVTFSSGVLTITGGSQADKIVVNEYATNGTSSTVHVEIETPSQNFFFYSGSPKPDGYNAGPSTDYMGVTKIVVNAKGGQDRIFHTGIRINPTIKGSGGDDFFSVYDIGSGSSYIDAGGGNDTVAVEVATRIPPGTGATTVHGGSGKDSLLINNDTSGAYDTSTSHALVYGDGDADTVTVYNGINTIVGDGGNDSSFIYTGANPFTDSGGTNNYYIGDAFGDYAGGQNTITGGGGVDTFHVFDGMNNLKGGSGNDIFHLYYDPTAAGNPSPNFAVDARNGQTIDGGGGTDSVYRHGFDNTTDTNSYTSIEKFFNNA